MKQLALVLAIVTGFTVAAQAETYRWVDDKGVVHYTDNPDRIPFRFLKRVNEIPTSGGDEPGQDGGAPEPIQQRQSQRALTGSSLNLPGGLSEQEWRARFTALRVEMKTLQDGLPEKRETLNQFRRKRLIYQRPQDRLAYNEHKDKIERDEARIKELEAQLAVLEIEASRAGVPIGWRQ